MKYLLKVSVFIFSVLLLSFSQAPKKPIITVVIDVSHGGDDLGSTRNGYSEKDIVLQIANKIQALEKDERIKIEFTRTGDENPSFSDRLRLSKQFKPNVFISLHVNTHKNLNSSGLEVLLIEDSHNFDKSVHLAETIHNAFEDSNSFRKSSIKHCNHYLLKNVSMPAVTVELGYLSNDIDFEILTSEEGQETIAKTIVRALEAY